MSDAQITAAVNRPTFDEAVQVYELALALLAPRQANPIRLSPIEIGMLAREVAIGMKELHDILKTFELTDAQYARIASNDHFQGIVTAARIEWNQATNIKQRLALEAAHSMEFVMPTITARMKDPHENLPAVVEAGKLFAKMAGVGEQAQSQISGEKFTITINLGEGQDVRVEKDVTPRGANQISADAEGAGAIHEV